MKQYVSLKKNKIPADVPAPSAPSFLSVVPHFLHSEASGSPRKSNSFISLNHPNRVEPLISLLHLTLPTPYRILE